MCEVIVCSKKGFDEVRASTVQYLWRTRERCMSVFVCTDGGLDMTRRHESG